MSYRLTDQQLLLPKPKSVNEFGMPDTPLLPSHAINEQVQDILDRAFLAATERYIGNTATTQTVQLPASEVAA
jgi:hypothetical protein